MKRAEQTAVRLADLQSLIKKYTRGEFVLWNMLEKDVEARLYRFSGVGRINTSTTLVEAAKRKRNGESGYCSTRAALAAFIGVSRTTLYNWETSGLITIKKRKVPGSLPRQKIAVYSGWDLLKQLEKLDESEQKAAK